MMVSKAYFHSAEPVDPDEKLLLRRQGPKIRPPSQIIVPNCDDYAAAVDDNPANKTVVVDEMEELPVAEDNDDAP